MTESNACNCFVCSKEFNCDELQSIALSKINVTRFKICQTCLDNSDPDEDYKQVRNIISSWLWFNEAKGMLKEAKEILDSFPQKDK
jgi:hypothetical protein